MVKRVLGSGGRFEGLRRVSQGLMKVWGFSWVLERFGWASFGVGLRVLWVLERFQWVWVSEFGVLKGNLVGLGVLMGFRDLVV